MFSSNTTQVSDGGYQISRSLRFNSADSAYLNRTLSASNRQKWTWSGWIKRSGINGTYQNLFQTIGAAGGDNDYFSFRIMNGEQIGVVLYSYFPLISTQVFRDPSAWYHFVCTLDTTQATASNRLKIYVNGSEITAWSTDNRGSISQNANLGINSAAQHNIGAYQGSSEFLSGYATEINFVDGQALTPSSFGETNAQTGVWQPKAYSGSYGTNGFYLNFSDNSNTTAATLGKDYSGNGNNWTPNNFSVSAGAGNDSLVDSPTSYGVDTGVGGTVRGNYATLNPLNATGAAAANGNLDVTLTSPGSTIAQIRGTIALTSGKWYWENTITTDGNQSTWFGVVSAATAANASLGSGQSVNQVIYARFDGTKTVNGTNSSYGSSYTTGDVIGVALDLDGGTVTFYKNNTSQGSISLPTTGIAYTPVYWWSSSTSAGAATYNFGQRPFAYTAPSGFKALCTQNLPTPTIGATSATLANKYFDATLYTGTGSTLAVTNAGGFQPDWVWLKNRSNTAYHSIWDAVRGRSAGGLASNDTGAEQASTAGNDFVSFNSNGFSVGPAQNWNVDTNGNTYVGWQWKANGSGSSNTAGSITSTVSANTTSGFSVVTYSGNGTSGATVGHGLGVTPSMVILKSRSGGTYDWRVYHSGLTAGYNIALNTTAAQYLGSSGNAGYISAVSSTTYTLTQSGANVLDAVNASGSTYVAYCFAPIAGFSAFGSYTGNGSTDGPFVFTGMRPAFLMTKRTDSATSGDWNMVDTTRGTYNVVGPYLYANQSAAEGNAAIYDILSNGFKIRESGAGTNASGSTYIYMAFASNPFKYSLAR